MRNLVEGSAVVDLQSVKSKGYVSLPNKNVDESVLLVEKYLNQLDWKVNENSNMDYSIQGLNNYSFEFK